MRTHRRFSLIAAATFVFAEILAIGNLISRTRFPKDFWAASSLPIFVTIPMIVAIVFYKQLQQCVAGRIDEASQKKLRTLLLVLLINIYAGLVVIFSVILNAAFHN
jgi:hypothetical protein